MIIMVTGATAGFGESITRRFIANGHKVINHTWKKRNRRLRGLAARRFLKKSAPAISPGPYYYSALFALAL